MTQAPSHTPPYRTDIDGLRAVAVLAVVLYHFGAPLPGGFVGVDIFFVISGFLIGGILWREYDQTGRVFLLNFYARRFRRLMPAFAVMVVVVTALAWALLLPFEFREYGKQVIAATVYLSNVLFYRDVGYFDGAAEDKPLLHTWSLAVEEQFYIFLPLFMLAFLRWRWGMLGGLVTTWVLSFAACLYATGSDQPAAFYLFPFRAWELLSGVLLAIWGYETGRSWRGYPVLSYAGMALIAASILFIPAGDGFPGVLAVAPVLGAVLVLSSGTGRNPVNRLLSCRIMVFFGLISYSLYLWHWPVFTLSTYLRDGYAGPVEAVLWVLLTVALGYASWRLVEQPVRRAQNMSGMAVLGGAALASTVTLGLGAAIFLRDGLPGRFGPDASVHIAASGDFLQDWSRCTVPERGPLSGLEVCPIGPDGPPEVLIWGDSHVRAFREGLDAAAHDAGTPGMILWRAGCPPLFDLRKVESAATQAQNTACTQANLQIKQSLAQMPSLERILLIGRWTYYAEGAGIGLDAHNTISLHPVSGPDFVGRDQATLLEQSARDTVAHMLDWFDEVVVLRQVPEIPDYDSRDAAREAAHAGWPLAAPPVTIPHVARADLEDRFSAVDRLWSYMADEGALSLIDPWPSLCDDTICQAIVDGTGQYFDNNHLTNRAALRLRGLFAPVMRGDIHETALRTVSGQ